MREKRVNTLGAALISKKEDQKVALKKLWLQLRKERIPTRREVNEYARQIRALPKNVGELALVAEELGDDIAPLLRMVSRNLKSATLQDHAIELKSKWFSDKFPLKQIIDASYSGWGIVKRPTSRFKSAQQLGEYFSIQIQTAFVKYDIANEAQIMAVEETLYKRCTLAIETMRRVQQATSHGLRKAIKKRSSNGEKSKSERDDRALMKEKIKLFPGIQNPPKR